MEKSLSIDFSKEKLNKKIQYFWRIYGKNWTIFWSFKWTYKWMDQVWKSKKISKGYISQEELYIKKDDQYKASKQYSYKVAHKPSDY